MEGDLSNPEHYGVIPRSAESIFDVLEKPQYISHEVVVSYLEIYNEELCDLLSDDFHDSTQRSSPKKLLSKLEILEGKDGVVCRGLTEKVVKNAADVLAVMKTAQKYRKIGETKMNKQSSRSHCVFTLRLSAKKQLNDGNIFDTRGKLHLVDLAGSECAKATTFDRDTGRGEGRDEISRERGRERSNINRSLLTLGRVIIMLKEQSTNKKSSHVRIPYRDSKLTRILQDSLGGRCKTLVIATVSPSIISIEETMSTLNYAQSASGIINKPVAVSYLSVGSGSRATTASTEISDNRSIEHWQEMEMRMEYLQSQVEEAQAALARQYREQKTIIDRAERAEEELVETQHKLEISELNLKKSTIILDATKETEKRLTAEATDLMKKLDFSVQDGNKLHSLLQESRDVDIQRREATKTFHASVLGQVDLIMEKLGNLKNEGDAHHSKVVKLTEDRHSQEHEELNESVQLLHEIQLLVSDLTMTMKSHVQDENGIMDILANLTKNVQDNMTKAKSEIESGEKKLISSIDSTRSDLQSKSKTLLKMEEESVNTTAKFSKDMESMLSETNRKVEKMVSSAVEALLQAKEDSSKTRVSLTETLASFHTVSAASIAKIQDQSQKCNQRLTKSLDSFNEGMKHIDEIQKDLIHQKDYIKTEGTAHLDGIHEQQNLVSTQNDDILNAMAEQKRLEQLFVQQVLKGVSDLVNEQMNLMSTKHEENLTLVEKRNNALSTLTDDVKSSAYGIFKDIKATNESVYLHTGETLANDQRMKDSVEKTQKVLGEVEQTSSDQREAESLFMAESYEKTNMLAEHEHAVATVSSTLQEDGTQAEEFINKEFKANMEKGVGKLSNLANDHYKFTNSSFNTTNTHLENALSPRAVMMQHFTNSADSIVRSVNEGKEKIVNVSNKQCDAADELRGGVEKKFNKFGNEVANKRRTDIDQHKTTIVQKTQGFSHTSSEALSKSVSSVSKTKLDIHQYANKTIKMSEEIPPIDERKKIRYSKSLSSTPAENVLIKDLIAENE